MIHPEEVDHLELTTEQMAKERAMAVFVFDNFPYSDRRNVSILIAFLAIFYGSMSFDRAVKGAIIAWAVFLFRSRLLIDPITRTVTRESGFWPFLSISKTHVDDLRFIHVGCSGREDGPTVGKRRFVAEIHWRGFNTEPWKAYSSTDFAEFSKKVDELSRALMLPVVEGKYLHSLRPQLPAAAYDAESVQS